MTTPEGGRWQITSWSKMPYRLYSAEGSLFRLRGKITRLDGTEDSAMMAKIHP